VDVDSLDRITLQELVEMIKRYIPNSKIEVEPGYDLGVPTQAYVDIFKAREELEYQPDFRKGEVLRDFIEMLRVDYNLHTLCTRECM